MATPEVVVIGGGIIGSACAHYLAASGKEVLVIDSDSVAGNSTAAAAGMLAPLAEATSEDPTLALAVRARDMYRELVPELNEATGIEIGYWVEGVLQVAFSEEEVASARNDVAWLRQSGFTAEWLSDDEVRQRCPGLSPDIMGGILAPEDGALEPEQLREALIQSAIARGAEVEHGQVKAVECRKGKVRTVKTTDGAIDCGAVVIAAGAWSGRIQGLPRPLSVEPLRGEMAALPWPDEEPGAVVYGAGGYVLRRGGEALAGSTMEFAGFDAGVSSAGIETVLDRAVRLYPALEGQLVQREWAGLRPATPDGYPILGADPEIPNLVYATGHGRNGILMAGFTGMTVATLIDGAGPEDLDLTSFSPERFWTY